MLTKGPTLQMQHLYHQQGKVSEAVPLVKFDSRVQDYIAVLILAAPIGQVKAELEAGLAILRGASVAAAHPLESPESVPAGIGPVLPPPAALISENDVSRPAKRQRTHASVPNNARMHPGTGYADEEPDFAQLAADDAQLTPFVRLLPSGG